MASPGRGRDDRGLVEDGQGGQHHGAQVTGADRMTEEALMRRAIALSA
jgi:hypothetical protein